MSIQNYKELKAHVGHKIVCVTYGKPHSRPVEATVECETCGEVLYSEPNFRVGKPRTYVPIISNPMPTEITATSREEAWEELQGWLDNQIELTEPWKREVRK